MTFTKPIDMIRFSRKSKQYQISSLSGASMTHQQPSQSQRGLSLQIIPTRGSKGSGFLQHGPRRSASFTEQDRRLFFLFFFLKISRRDEILTEYPERSVRGGCCHEGAEPTNSADPGMRRRRTAHFLSARWGVGRGTWEKLLFVFKTVLKR